jgi:hypothetical protein
MPNNELQYLQLLSLHHFNVAMYIAEFAIGTTISNMLKTQKYIYLTCCKVALPSTYYCNGIVNFICYSMYLYNYSLLFSFSKYIFIS